MNILLPVLVLIGIALGSSLIGERTKSSRCATISIISFILLVLLIVPVGFFSTKTKISSEVIPIRQIENDDGTVTQRASSVNLTARSSKVFPYPGKVRKIIYRDICLGMWIEEKTEYEPVK